MEVKIDTESVMTAALARTFAETNPEGLAEAMAKVALQRTSYGSKTVLQEVVESAVRELARAVITELLEAHKDAITEQIRHQLAGREVDVKFSNYEQFNVKVVL